MRIERTSSQAFDHSSPRTHQQHSCCKSFLERRLNILPFLAIPALVKRFTSKIERDRSFLRMDRYIDLHIWAVLRDLRSLACLRAQFIADRILHAHGRKLSVAQLSIRPVCRNCNRSIWADMLLPRNRTGLFVKFISARASNTCEHEQHARSAPQPQAGLERIFDGTEKGNAPFKGANTLDALTLQFFRDRSARNQPGRPHKTRVMRPLIF